MAKFVDNYTDLKELGIDCDQSNDSLTETFNRASNHLQNLLPDVDSHMLLMLYGYYKQGSEGVCNIPKPSWYDMKAKSKWEAWRKLGNMSQAEAKSLYIDSIKKLDPSFDCAEENTPKEQWIKVSSMLDEKIIAESDKTIVDHIKEGNIEEVKKYLDNTSTNKVSINMRDADGLAPIHWAADSGFLGIIEILVRSGADVNIHDAEGQTALHYASSCGHVDCVKYLLEHGAKVDCVDNEGQTPLSVASDDSVKELLNSSL